MISGLAINPKVTILELNATKALLKNVYEALLTVQGMVSPGVGTILAMIRSPDLSVSLLNVGSICIQFIGKNLASAGSKELVAPQPLSIAYSLTVLVMPDGGIHMGWEW